MAINNVNWSSGEKITSAKLNLMAADEVNSINDIHPQYNSQHLGLPFELILQRTGSSLFIFSLLTRSVGGGTELPQILLSGIQGISSGNIPLWNYSFKRNKWNSIRVRYLFKKNIVGAYAVIIANRIDSYDPNDITDSTTSLSNISTTIISSTGFDLYDQTTDLTAINSNHYIAFSNVFDNDGGTSLSWEVSLKKLSIELSL